MPTEAKVAVILDLERETATTFRYLERGDRRTHIVHRVYLRKAEQEALGSPESIRVTIEAA